MTDVSSNMSIVFFDPISANSVSLPLLTRNLSYGYRREIQMPVEFATWIPAVTPVTRLVSIQRIQPEVP